MTESVGSHGGSVAGSVGWCLWQVGSVLEELLGISFIVGGEMGV